MYKLNQYALVTIANYTTSNNKRLMHTCRVVTVDTSMQGVTNICNWLMILYQVVPTYVNLSLTIICRYTYAEVSLPMRIG